MGYKTKAEQSDVSSLVKDEAMKDHSALCRCRSVVLVIAAPFDFEVVGFERLTFAGADCFKSSF